MVGNRKPWWTKISQNSVSKAEQQRRRKRTRKPSGPYKVKTDIQKLKSLCKKYCLTDRGNVRNIIVRLIQYFESLIESYKKEGAPDCFGQAYQCRLCNECVLQSECKPLCRDIKKVKRLMNKIDIERKIKSFNKKEKKND